MNASDHAEFAAIERDTDDALGRAHELHEDQPHLTAPVILAALDDEFAGSSFWPSGSSSFVKKVERLVGG